MFYSNNMQSISQCFDEYHKRWRRVEHICGFQVCSSPNSPTHNLTQSSTHSSHGHNYNSQTYFSSAMSRDLSTNSIATYLTLDGLSLRHGSAGSASGDMPAGYGALHRSSTLPRFRGRSNSITLTEADSSFYQQPKSRSSSVSSSSTSSGSQAFLRSFKSGGPPPLCRQQSTEGDVDIADCVQFVGNQPSQHVPSQIQHHQLHLSSVSPKRPEIATPIAEPSEGPSETGQARPPRPPLKTCASLPAFLVRKDSYHEAIHSGGGEAGGGGGGGGSIEQQQAESINGGGITFTTSNDSNSNTATASKGQPSNESTKSSLKSQLLPASYRAASLNAGLEAIREERASQISLTSSGSGDSRSMSSRASSSSPDKPKVKGRSLSPRATTVKGRNHRSISSDV